MHEFGHVLGLGHVGVSKALYPTVMQTSPQTTPYAHLGLESGTELYDLDLQAPGLYELPIIDYLFLNSHYGLYLPYGDPRIHQFEGVINLELYVDVGWEGTTNLFGAPFDAVFLGSVLEPPCTTGEPAGSLPYDFPVAFSEAVKSVLPRFTYRDTATLTVDFATVSVDTSASSTSGWAILEGEATIDVLGDGTYSYLPTGLTPLTVTDAYVSGDTGTHQDVLLTATFRDAATDEVYYSDVPINAYITLVGCDEE